MEQFMNPPESHNGQAYIEYDLRTGQKWAYCPHCGKKAFPISDGAEILNQEFQCRGSSCKKKFIVNYTSFSGFAPVFDKIEARINRKLTELEKEILGKSITSLRVDGMYNEKEFVEDFSNAIIDSAQNPMSPELDWSAL